MSPQPAEVQCETLKSIWQQYRAQGKTSRKLKAEQGRWRQVLLVATIMALLAVPFSKTLDKVHLAGLASALVVVATVLFVVLGWLNKELLGDDSQQAWVRTRQTGEGLKSLAFRFLGGVAPFDGADAATLALARAQELVTKAGSVTESLDEREATEEMPPVPLSAADYVRCRVDDQLAFYTREANREKAIEAKITNIGRLISLGVAVFGALGAVIAQEWRDIWAPALGVASSTVTTQAARSRHRFLSESYSMAAVKLGFARAAWSISGKSEADDLQLVTSVESILAEENGGWVQQMLLKPIVADSSSSAPKAKD